MWLLTPAPKLASVAARPPRPSGRPADTRSLVAALVAVLLVLTLLAASPGWAAPARADDRVPDRILVRFEDGAPAGARAAARRDARATELSTIDRLGVRVWRVPEHAAARALAGLQRNPHVAYAEHDRLVRPADVIPNDPAWKDQWGPKRVNTPRAWVTTTGSSAVTIAVVDSGVNDIGDMRGKLVRGFNAMDGTGDTTDNHGHGTRAASVAGAGTNNSAGIAAYCWQCPIMPVKVFDSGGALISDSARGFVWAVDNGAKVISFSMGGPTPTSTQLAAVRYAVDRGVLVVAAAGNYGNDTPIYPAAYPEVVGVAGTTSGDALYSWSNHGAWVEVSAPGVNHAVSRTGSVGSFSGTSSATPAVSGVIGLGLATGASPERVRTALEATAAPLPFVRHGRVDAAAMLAGLGSSAPAPEPEPEPEPEPAPEPEPVRSCHPKKGCDGGGGGHKGGGPKK